MFKEINSQSKLCRNYLIIYIIVGLFSSWIADSYQTFQLSSQSNNASQFSRIISFSFAYSTKENLYK